MGANIHPGVISSRQNRWFQRFRHAIEAAETEIVLEGPKAVADAIAKDWSPLAVAIEDGVEFDVHEAPAIRLDRSLFRRLSDTSTSQGVLGLFERRESSIADLLRPPADGIVIALDGNQDPGNAGTIVRLAAAFSARGVVALPGTANLWGPKAIRSSAGAILNTAVARSDAEEMLKNAREHGWRLVCAGTRDGSAEVDLRGAILVLGAEGRGVSKFMATRGESISIAMSDRVESLNVAAAAAILLSREFEKRR